MWNNHPNSPTIKWIDTDMKKKKIVGAIKKKKPHENVVHNESKRVTAEQI